MVDTYVYTGAAGGTDWNNELDFRDDQGHIVNQRFSWTVYSDINNPATGAALDGLYPNDPLPTTSTDVQIGPAGGSLSYQVTLSEADHYGKKGGARNLSIAAGSSLTLLGGSQGPGAPNLVTILTVNGNIHNVGGIAFQTSAYHGSGILLQSNTVLDGGGTVTMGDISFYSNAGFFNAAGYNTTLTNVDNYISGSGQISNVSDVGAGANSGTLTFVNHGIVNANATVPFLIDAGSATAATVNTGTFEATGTGALSINTPTLDNRGGSIYAADGATVTLTATHLIGGTLSSSGSGQIVLVGSGNILDGSLTNGAITSTATIVLNPSSSAVLRGGLTNNGLIEVNAAQHANATLLLDGNFVLDGSGMVQLQEDVYGPQSIVNVAGQSVTLTNSNTIVGNGAIGSNGAGGRLDLVNKGSIVADNAQVQLTINAATVANTGTIAGAGAAGLALSNTVLTTTGAGKVEARDGSHVDLISSTISGALSSSGSGQIVLVGSGNILDGSPTNGAITSTATIVLNPSSSAILRGGLINNGLIEVNAAQHANATLLLDGDVVLDGSGMVQLQEDVYGPQSIVNVAGQSVTLTNSNTIVGNGAIGTNGAGGRLDLVNKGSIVADNAQLQLTINAATVANTGTLAGAGAAGLALSNTVLTTTGAGKVEARDGSHVDLASSTISGKLTSSGSGSIRAIDNLSTLNNAVLSGNLTIADKTLTVKGTFQDNGTVHLSAGSYSSAAFKVAGSTTFSGTGTIDFSSTLAYSGVSLTNVDNQSATLTNAGTLTLTGLGGTILTNGAAFTLLNTGTLAVAGGVSLNLGYAGPTVVNTGSLGSTGSGVLSIVSTSIKNQGGTISAAAGSHIDLSSNTIIFGGTLSTTGSGYLDTLDSTVTLGGASFGPITSTAQIKINDGTSLAIAGPFMNNGLIQIGASGGGQLNAGASLTGSGSIVLTNSGSAIVGGFTNSGNSITGQGTISASVDLELGGSINANVVGATLALTSTQATINNGVLEAEAGNLTVATAVSGSGSALVKGGGRLVFSSTFNQNVLFQGANAGTLVLSQAYAGKISGFARGDTVDFAGIAFASADKAVFASSAGGGAVNIVDTAHGNTVLASLTLAGSYTHGQFTLASDGATGTTLRYNPVAPVGDYNGDGTSDILWQQTGGAVYDWGMTGGSHTANTTVANPGALPTSQWTLIGTGDFNGDHTRDLLWQNNASGATYEWGLTNGVKSSDVSLGTLPSSQYKLIATGDFNGDGTSDLLWQSQTNGAVYDWGMTNGQHTANTTVAAAGALPLATWAMIGKGDFNGDGTTDLLWQNKQSGAVYEWTMTNGQHTGDVSLGTVSPSQYALIGTGDFNGDGTTDLIWQDQPSGAVYEWGMQNGQHATNVSLGTLPTSQWSLLTTGDFHGSGTDDLLWQNKQTGALYDWGMSGGQHTTNSSLGSLLPTDWHTLSSLKT